MASRRSARMGRPSAAVHLQSLGIAFALVAPLVVMVVGAQQTRPDRSRTSPVEERLLGADSSPTQTVRVDGPGSYVVRVENPGGEGAVVVELVSDEPLDFTFDPAFLPSVPTSTTECAEAGQPLLRWATAASSTGGWEPSRSGHARYVWSAAASACHLRQQGGSEPTTASRYRLAVWMPSSGSGAPSAFHLRVNAQPPGPR